MSEGRLLFIHSGQQRAVGDRLIANVVFWSMKPLPMPTNSKSKVNGFPGCERPILDP